MGRKAQADLKDGDVVLLKQGLGIVRYRGRVPTKKGIQVGIELVGDGVGDTDGSVNERYFFKCKPGMGIFLPAKKVKKKITPAALLKKIERLNSGVVELKMKFVELEDSHHMLQEEHHRILAMSDGGSQYTDFDQESSMSGDDSHPPPFGKEEHRFSESNGHTVISEPMENESEEPPRRKKKKKRVQFGSGVFEGHERDADVKEDKWSRTALSASLFDDLFDDEDETWGDETEEEEVEAYDREEDMSEGGMEMDPIPEIPEVPNFDHHVAAMKNTFINDMNFSMDIDVREAEIEEQRLQLRKRLKLLGSAMMEDVDEKKLTEENVTKHVEEWVAKMKQREKELEDRAATYKLRERKQMEKEKHYIKEKKEMKASKAELVKLQSKADTARRMLNDLEDNRVKWNEMLEKNKSECSMLRMEITQKFTAEKNTTKNMIHDFERRMRETVLAEKNELEDLRQRLNDQDAALNSREKLLQQNLNALDQRQVEIETKEKHLNGNMKDFQEQQEFFAEQCREFDRKTTGFQRLREETETKFKSDKEKFDRERAELDAEIIRYREGHNELSKNQHAMMEKLKILTERELGLEAKEEALDQREFEVKGEYKSCLREQKRLKKLRKDAQEEQNQLEELHEKVMRNQKKLKHERNKLKNDQRDFSQVKRRHHDELKAEQMKIKKDRAHLKAKEKDLDDEQRQLLLDSVGGDSYAQLVDLRKQLQKLHSDPGLHQEEKLAIEQRRLKLESDRRSFEQEKVIYEKFQENDQAEIAALRDELKKKIQKEEEIRKQLELAKMNAEEEKERAKFEQEQYLKQKEKHIGRTHELENDLKQLNLQFETSVSLETRSEKVEQMRKQVTAEREFMKQQNAKLKSSLADIQEREEKLQTKIQLIQKEKADLRAKNKRLEAKQVELKNQEKLLKDDWEEFESSKDDSERKSMYIGEKERHLLEQKLDILEKQSKLEERERTFSSNVITMQKVRDLLVLVNQGL